MRYLAPATFLDDIGTYQKNLEILWFEPVIIWALYANKNIYLEINLLAYEAYAIIIC